MCRSSGNASANVNSEVKHTNEFCLYTVIVIVVMSYV